MPISVLACTQISSEIWEGRCWELTPKPPKFAIAKNLTGDDC